MWPTDGLRPDWQGPKPCQLSNVLVIIAECHFSGPLAWGPTHFNLQPELPCLSLPLSQELYPTPLASVATLLKVLPGLISHGAHGCPCLAFPGP